MFSAMPKGTVLVVEDEADLLELLRYNLERDGYRVLAARDAETGLGKLHRGKPDLILLDVALPGMDGFEFCSLVRRRSQIPIVFLTARKEETERVLGLRMGGDDYVTKPFSIPELLARVHARLRRLSPENNGGPDAGVLRVDRLEVDLTRHEVRQGDRIITLAPKEFQLLRALLEADGKVISREELLRRVWGVADDAEPLDTRTVDQHVSRLRRKLAALKSILLTVPKFGYKLLRETAKAAA